MRMLSRLSIKNGVGWSVLTRKMFKDTGAEDSETDNFINFIRSIRDVRIAVLFKEFGPRTVKVSFRGKPGIDVNSIAKAFDGGGHKYAAGCTVRKPLAAAMAEVLSAVRKYEKKRK